jgi:hypothetical protein
MRFESITIHYFSKRIEDKRAKMLQNFNNQKKKSKTITEIKMGRLASFTKAKKR